MPDKNPENWPIAAWLLALIMALVGGLIDQYVKYKQGHPHEFRWVESLAKVFISGFVGIGVFMVLENWWPPGVCAAASGMAGYMGIELLTLMRTGVAVRIKDHSHHRDGDDYRDQ